jgi:hypothetical protein
MGSTKLLCSSAIPGTSAMTKLKAKLGAAIGCAPLSPCPETVVSSENLQRERRILRFLGELLLRSQASLAERRDGVCLPLVLRSSPLPETARQSDANPDLFNVRRQGDEAKAAAKEQVYACRVATNADLQKAGQVLGSSPMAALPKANLSARYEEKHLNFSTLLA